MGETRGGDAIIGFGAAALNSVVQRRMLRHACDRNVDTTRCDE